MWRNHEAREHLQGCYCRGHRFSHHRLSEIQNIQKHGGLPSGLGKFSVHGLRSFAQRSSGNTGVLYLALAAGGAITGSLNYGGGTFPLTGVCTTANITFTLSDGTVFTGGFYYTAFDPYIASMVGTFAPDGNTWVAVPQR